jgi:hypothetical protein
MGKIEMKTCYRLELSWDHRVVVREPLGQQDFEVHYQSKYKNRFLGKANSCLFRSDSFKECMLFALKFAVNFVEKELQ